MGLGLPAMMALEALLVHGLSIRTVNVHCSTQLVC